MKVLELMKVHVVRIAPEATVREAVDMIDLYQVQALPVVDSEGRILGITSEADLAGRILTAIPDTGEWRTIGATPIREVMTAPAVFIDEEAEADEALSLMLEHGIDRLPVTGGSRLAGMLSRNDICQALLDGRLGN